MSLHLLPTKTLENFLRWISSNIWACYGQGERRQSCNMLFLPQVMKIKGQLPLSITFNFPRLSIKPGKERVGIVRVRRMLRRKNSLGRIRFTLHWEWFSNHQYSVSQTSVKDPPPLKKTIAFDETLYSFIREKRNGHFFYQ